MNAASRSPSRTELGILDPGQGMQTRPIYNDSIAREPEAGAETLMPARSASHLSMPRHVHAWRALLPVLAYLLLVFHASFAQASTLKTRAGILFPVSISSTTTSNHNDPQHLPPCCNQHLCSTLAVVGPLLPSNRVLPTGSHSPETAILARPGTLSPATASIVLQPLRELHSSFNPPIYLSTARLRL